MSVQIPANVLRAALVCAGSRDVRYYLNGVYVDTRKGAHIDIVSTDGHRMFAHRIDLKEVTPAELRREWILDRNDLTDVLKGATSIHLTGVDDGFAVARIMLKKDLRGKRRQLIGMIDGKYPDWTRVLGSSLAAAEAPAQFNPDYVGSMMVIARHLDGGRGSFAYPAIKCKGCDMTAPASLVFFRDEKSVAAIMPLREHAIAAPAWLDAYKPTLTDKAA